MEWMREANLRSLGSINMLRDSSEISDFWAAFPQAVGTVIL